MSGIECIQKRKWAVIILLLVLMAQSSFLLSCTMKPRYPQGVAEEVRADRLRIERYVELMDDGKTTPEQDQKMIKATLKAFRGLEYAMFRDDTEKVVIPASNDIGDTTQGEAK